MKKLLSFILLILLAGCQNQPSPTHIDSSATDNLSSQALLTTKLKQNPWRFIKKQSNISIPLNQRIREEQEKLLKNKSAFEQLLSRSEPYMYYIINQLQQRNMPVEIALIPLIESAYNPQATSSAKAAGLWQIVPITAKAHGMVANKWYDPRRDLIESTQAALNYLEYLNKIFDGDWLLTLAAYNAGEGRVKRAQQWSINNHLPAHFWALNLPKETMQYIPKFLAVADLIRHNKNFGITLPDYDYDNALVKVNIGQQIKLADLCKYTDLSLDELTLYNAAYLKKTLNGPYYLLIPKNQAESLYSNLLSNNFNSAAIVDLLSIPADTDDILPNKTNNTNLKYLTITDADLQFYAKEHLRHSQIIYRIKPGDNLSMIAKNHRVKISQLLQWNKIQNAHKLKPGDRLVINIRH
ncbi:transglycosylase SLT domain-containing protein [Utexia brackfieldae]|uniref:transglycosylase SLT domain-containing protein n=1 Tax=Utexia brackfieldae TaxID=3074108 RepID=UPI00370D79E9